MYYDEDYIPPEPICAELRRKIYYLMKRNRRGCRFEDVTDEVIACFYPKLSEKEKCVCRLIIEYSYDLGYCPCWQIKSVALKDYRIIRAEWQVKNTILNLCMKNVINWMTLLIPEKSENGEILRINRREIYRMNPPALQDMAREARYQFLRFRKNTETRTNIELYDVKYSSFLTLSKLDREEYPIIN